MERNLTNHASAGPTKYIWRKHWKFTTPHFLLVVQPWITIVTAPFFLPNVKYHIAEREKDKKKDGKSGALSKNSCLYFWILPIKYDEILILNIVLTMKKGWRWWKWKNHGRLSVWRSKNVSLWWKQIVTSYSPLTWWTIPPDCETHFRLQCWRWWWLCGWQKWQ